MTEDEATNLTALALANHAMMVKLLAVLKADNVISAHQISDALQRAHALVSEGGSIEGLRAAVLIEGVLDSLV